MTLVLDQVLGLARRKGAQADALLRDTTVLSLSFEAGRLKGSALSQEAGLNLRVIANGRIGIAGTTDLTGPDDVVRRAFASAAEGEALELALPTASQLPSVETFDGRAEGLDVARLAALGRAVVERLQRPGWQVTASVERHLETARFANTSGQAFEQRASAVTLGAEVTRVSGDDVLMAYDTFAANGPPEASDLERLAGRIVRKIELSERIVEPPEGRLPVLFTPEGLEAVLMPVRQALSGKSVLQGISPLGGKIGETMFDARFSLTDDPLAAGRIASRAADDEGVPSARLPLVERGVVMAFVYDLETAARAKARSTGHGSRSTFGKPGIQFSNLVLRTGEHDESQLLADVGNGLVVDELIGVGQGNVSSGSFSHPVALAWRVDKGEITGRVKDAAIAGNAFELLRRIIAIGREGRWLNGTRYVPPIVIEGVNVARR
ncbi:MAG: TldD/PmbA family protein [Gemmatimonadales bacterium]